MEGQSHQLLGYSSGIVGWISAVNCFFSLLLGVQIGPLFDKHGPRHILLFGTMIYVVSLVVLGQCKTYWQLMLVYGVFCGTANAMLTTAALSVIAHWFEERRGMASGITFVGSSAGGIVFPLLLNPVLQKLSWAWAMRLVALIVLVLMIIANLCIKGRLPPKSTGGSVDLRCFLDARFSWATAGVACKFIFHPLRLSG